MYQIMALLEPSWCQFGTLLRGPIFKKCGDIGSRKLELNSDYVIQRHQAHGRPLRTFESNLNFDLCQAFLRVRMKDDELEEQQVTIQSFVSVVRSV